MEFLKSSKRRSVLSEIVYIGLNIALALSILVVVRTIDSPLPAFGLVILSKWRILAVRPRYWFANIQANMVDIIVSLGIVVLLSAAGNSLVAQLIITALYIVWLLFIKPRSRRSYVTIQAGAAVFLGVTAIMTVSYDWIASLVVLPMWLIGYSTARHVISNYEDTHTEFYSLVWGLVFAELGWLGYHWTFAYSIPGMGGLMLSQTAIIVLLVSFLVERAYNSYSHHGTVRINDIILPTLLSVSITVILLTVFSQLGLAAI